MTTLRPQDIARLIDRLDHPDAHRQRAVMDDLIALGPEATPVLGANLALVNARGRRALVQVLGELADERALLPLMRYVFDTRNKVDEADGRALAMGAIGRVAGAHADPRLFDFATEMVSDADPFVRRGALALFATLSQRRALPYVREALDDADSMVRDEARRTLDALEALPPDEQIQTMPARALAETLAGAAGQRLRYLVDDAARRPDALSLARALLGADARAASVGMRLLQKLTDARVRGVVAEHLARTDDPEQWAVGLRILERELHADIGTDEARLIRRGLGHRDRFVDLAALACAARSGDPALVTAALEGDARLDRDELARLLEALADSLTALPSDTPSSDAPAAASSAWAGVLARLDTLSARLGAQRRAFGRSAEPDATVHAEAYALRAMARLYGRPDLAARLAVGRSRGLDALVGASRHRPVLVTALELLDQVVPEGGLSEEARWAADETLLLAQLLDEADDPRIHRRVVNLLRRVMPDGAAHLAPAIARVFRSPGLELVADVIPALKRARSQAAADVLRELARDEHVDVRNSAKAVLRSWRNDAPFIDVEFESDADD